MALAGQTIMQAASVQCMQPSLVKVQRSWLSISYSRKAILVQVTGEKRGGFS